MIIDYKTSFGKTYRLKPRLELYSVLDYMGNKMPGLAIVLDEADGEGEQFGMLTVSFGEMIGLKNAAYIDTNNLSGANVFLRADIAQDTGFTHSSGYCTYPLWLFNEDFLKECGTENYEKYSKAFDEYFAAFTDDASCDDSSNNEDTQNNKMEMTM